jgi:hypothetical protein
MLEDATIRQLGDRYFIVGPLADRGDGTDDERIGCTFWFALDEVVMLTEFSSVAKAREAHNKRAARKQQEQGGQSKRRGWFG